MKIILEDNETEINNVTKVEERIEAGDNGTFAAFLSIQIEHFNGISAKEIFNTILSVGTKTITVINELGNVSEVFTDVPNVSKIYTTITGNKKFITINFRENEKL